MYVKHVTWCLIPVQAWLEDTSEIRIEDLGENSCRPTFCVSTSTYLVLSNAIFRLNDLFVCTKLLPLAVPNLIWVIWAWSVGLTWKGHSEAIWWHSECKGGKRHKDIKKGFWASQLLTKPELQPDLLIESDNHRVVFISWLSQLYALSIKPT